jgi:LysM repeat protein
LNKAVVQPRFMKRGGSAPCLIHHQTESHHPTHIMTPIRILAPSVLAVALVSCAAQKDQYDTPDPYGTADAGAVNPPVTAPANPVYDTPAAYEESGTAAVSPAVPGIPAVPATPAAPAVPAPPANGSAVIHTVVAGDTLSGLSAKYKIPSASIKQANRMTNDTVVLGRKMVIPPR